MKKRILKEIAFGLLWTLFCFIGVGIAVAINYFISQG